MAAPSGPSVSGGCRQQPSASGAVQGGVGFSKASGPLGPVVFGTGVAQSVGAQPATGAFAFRAAAPQAMKPGQKCKKKKKKTGNGQPHVQGAPTVQPASQARGTEGEQPDPGVIGQDAKKPKTRRWKCEVDTHATKDCTIAHYCYICDDPQHSLKKCPTLKLPKPTVLVAGQGDHDTMFSLFPSSVYKPHMGNSGAPTTLVSVEGLAATAAQVEAQVARICPNPSWVWEVVPNGDDSFTLSFPSKEDLMRIDGIVLGIPAHNTRLLFSQWRPEEVEPIMELHQTWVHVSGVPPSKRHFLGLWAVGTLIGSTIDVDLLALRRRGIVCILVGMVADDCFRKIDALGPYIKTTSVLVLKGYAFTFRPEDADFIPEPDFVPFFWERKEKDDPADKGSEGRDETGHKGKQSSTCGNLGATDMAIDTNSGQSSTHVQSASVAHLLNGMAITPINQNPHTPRGKELVRKLKQSGGWNRMVGTHLVPKQLLGRTATQMRTVATQNSASCMVECGM
ncbi:hypothetical protein ZWY2020_051608 [Hordeum vulgare]|nr:hypothetical protein ZWY2020_051608 [Hordeum vulgare]